MLEGRGCVYEGVIVVIILKNKLVRDIFMGYVEVIIFNLKLFLVYYIDGIVVFLLSKWLGKNYFYWMIDIVIRINLLEKSYLKIDKYVFNSIDKRFN